MQKQGRSKGTVLVLRWKQGDGSRASKGQTDEGVS